MHRTEKKEQKTGGREMTARELRQKLFEIEDQDRELDWEQLPALLERTWYLKVPVLSQFLSHGKGELFETLRTLVEDAHFNSHKQEWTIGPFSDAPDGRIQKAFELVRRIKKEVQG